MISGRSFFGSNTIEFMLLICRLLRGKASRFLGIEASAFALHIRCMDKEKVAEILVEIGTLLELKGENPFKTRAYSNAARAIEGLSEPLPKIVAEDRLGEIKGIGEGIARKITELVKTGKLAYYDELKSSIAP